MAITPTHARAKEISSQPTFPVDYNFNSNHIEGNTLTYGQTELLLLFGKVAGEGDYEDSLDRFHEEMNDYDIMDDY